VATVQLFLVKPKQSIKGEYHLSVGNSPRTVCRLELTSKKLEHYVPFEATIEEVLAAYRCGKLCRHCSTKPRRRPVLVELRNYVWWTQGVSV
jgi:hypothetical protein